MKVLRSGGAYLEAREWWEWTGLAVVALAVFLAAIQLLSLHRGSPVVLAAALLAAALVAVMAKRATPRLMERLRATRKGRLGERLTTQLVARLSDDYYLIIIAPATKRQMKPSQVRAIALALAASPPPRGTTR